MPLLAVGERKVSGTSAAFENGKVDVVVIIWLGPVIRWLTELFIWPLEVPTGLLFFCFFQRQVSCGKNS